MIAELWGLRVKGWANGPNTSNNGARPEGPDRNQMNQGVSMMKKGMVCLKIG